MLYTLRYPVKGININHLFACFIKQSGFTFKYAILILTNQKIEFFFFKIYNILALPALSVGSHFYYIFIYYFKIYYRRNSFRYNIFHFIILFISSRLEIMKTAYNTLTSHTMIETILFSRSWSQRLICMGIGLYYSPTY